MKWRVLFSLVVGLGAVLVNWLILGDSSPLHEYFLRHAPGIRGVWLPLNFIPVLLSVIASSSHGGGNELVYVVMVFVQWFTIAFVVSSFLTRLRHR